MSSDPLQRRIERLEDISHALAEGQLAMEKGLANLQQIVADLATATRQGFDQVAHRFRETDERLRETDRRIEERFRRTDEQIRATGDRIDKLVSAMGEFIRRQPEAN